MFAEGKLKSAFRIDTTKEVGIGQTEKLIHNTSATETSADPIGRELSS